MLMKYPGVAEVDHLGQVPDVPGQVPLRLPELQPEHRQMFQHTSFKIKIHLKRHKHEIFNILKYFRFHGDINENISDFRVTIPGNRENCS